MIKPLRCKTGLSNLDLETQHVAPTTGFRGTIIESVVQLERMISDWEELIESSIRKNPYFDPDFLIPALKHLNDVDASVLVIDAPAKNGTRVLCALMPIVKKRVYGMPVRSYEIWKHDQCIDATPLIRKEVAAEVIDFVFQYMEEEMKAKLFSFDTVSNEGEFGRLLSENIRHNKRNLFNHFTFDQASGSNNVPAQSNPHQPERQLSDLGELETEVLSSTDQIDKWTDQFLKLEASSASSEDVGPSLVSRGAHRKFFREMALRSLVKGKLSMIKVNFIGQPIGIFCNFHQGSEGIHFKTCFDRSYSPKLIAELEKIYQLHASSLSQCPPEDDSHKGNDQVSSGRTKYQSVVVALKGRVARWATSALPLLKMASQKAN